MENNTNRGANTKPKLAWRVLWISFTALLFSFVPFFGYTYLVSKLDGAGFERVNIDPKIYDLVFYAFEAFISPIKSVLTSSIWEAVLNVLPRALILGLGMGLIIILTALFIRVIENRKEKEDSTKLDFPTRVGGVIKNSAYSFKDALITLSGGIFMVVIVHFFIIVSIFVVIVVLALLWVLAMQGAGIGYQDGESIINKPICFVQAEVKEPPPLIKCSKININGNMKNGKRVYIEGDITYFVTNDGSYQVNTKGEILYFKPKPTSSDADLGGSASVR